MNSNRVVVLAGGLSHERDVSLRSGRRVAEALREAGAEVDVRDVDADLLRLLREAGAGDQPPLAGQQERRALADHGAPLRRRRLHAEAEEREAGLEQDHVADGERRGHQQHQWHRDQDPYTPAAPRWQGAFCLCHVVPR